ncbi:uncharacterized protein LOC105019922 [Esox lucius]|uniref:Interleukin-1 n=1 Tax=Esox lucius TaxID=8010 RepID=A0A3P8ZY80_ESOLU|nr:uncharacterized protein LOC105019922 [Esox lucius]XP_010884779.2 uncharacterized protein LOC105019922 [Esox lucius]
MDIKDSPVKGGVTIIHTEEDGKHHYQVEKVLRFKKGGLGGGAFASHGDMFVKINGLDLEDVAPEEFAKMLAKEHPMLTILPASRPPPETCPEGEVLQPVTKENIMFSFSLEMRREDDMENLEIDGYPPRDDITNENVSAVDDDDDDDDDDLILVAMRNTTISVIRGRGNCDGKPCDINEVVMVAESSKITHVSRGMGNLENVKQWDNTYIENFIDRMYLRSQPTRARKIIPTLSENPEKITIYHYKSDCVDGDFKGVPVVLNFTNSNCFLKCVQDGKRVFLNVEACDKNKLKSIKKDDMDVLPFVFYMKAEGSKTRQFESAVCQGWFIHTSDQFKVVLEKPQTTADKSFFFIIHK